MAHTSNRPDGQPGALQSPIGPAGWLAAELHGLPEAERRDALAGHLREHVASILEIGDPRGLDPNRPLFEMGLTSVRAMEVRDALSSSLAVTLPATLLFDHPTVTSLTSCLAQEILGVEAPDEPEPAANNAWRLMEDIERLSDEEATALLARDEPQ